MSKYTGKIVEFHILQSFPVSCLNRDEMGVPKSAIIGGVSRARVSSQCWKRQVRMTMHNMQLGPKIKLGTRTKDVEGILTKACLNHGLDEKKAEEQAKALAGIIASSNTLCFLSPGECDVLGSFAAENQQPEDKKGKENWAKKVINELESFQSDGMDALDIALFGRMMAQAPQVNVEAAAAFSHAISTHKVSTEFDFFTALDDLQGKDQTGSAHMGTLEFNSATYYRYVSLDLGILARTLGLEEDDRRDDLKQAVAAFVKALYIAVPSARQTTMSASCPWDFAHIYIRHGQRIQASFDKPVRAKDGYLSPSIEALESWLELKKVQMGAMFGMQKEIVMSPDSRLSIDKIVEDIAEAV